MSMESDLTTLLKTVTPNVFPDFAPSGTTAPYVVYQGIGGQALRWLDGTAADKRHTLMQIDVWAGTRAAALALSRQVEAVISNVGAVPFMAQPESEPAWDSDEEGPHYGCSQDFRIISTR
jgi:hypothetical protein